jgi:hypothetical protein
MYLTLGEALTAVSGLGLLAGAAVAVCVMLRLCDRHSDVDYAEGKVDGYNQALGRLFDGTIGAALAAAPVEAEPDGDAWAAELAAMNRDLAGIPAPRAAQTVPDAPAAPAVDGETTFVHALRIAPLERVGDVFDGYRPPPDRPSWLAAHVHRLIDRAGRRP